VTGILTHLDNYATILDIHLVQCAFRVGTKIWILNL